MVDQLVTPALRRWIREQTEAGQPPLALQEAMERSGWEPGVAARALAEGMRPEGAMPRALPELCVPEGLSHWEDQGGHAVQVLASLQHPRVAILGQMLSPAECAALIDEARPRLSRSETVVNETGGSEVNRARTSQGMFFQRGETSLCRRIEARIAALLGWPVEHGEGLQVLRYAPGAEYKAHYDYFDPDHAGTSSILRRGGQRVATLVMYLNTPEEGGATVFPDAGLSVSAVAGQAVFFAYGSPEPSSGTLHGGAPVVRGEKWVATKWLREGHFE
jgi:prolyl 4-hydroxylase